MPRAPSLISRWQRTPRKRIAYAIVVLAALFGVIGAVTGVGTGLERSLHGVRDTVRQRPASAGFVLVEIDARSLAKLDSWPWPRRLYANAITMLERAGATTVAFDVDLSARSIAAEDRALADALARTRVPVIMPTFRQAASQTSATTLENAPLPEFASHAQLAAVNIQADADGMVRSYPYGVTTGKTPRPSIGAILAGAAGRSDTDFPIDGAIDPSSIARISFVDLVQGRVPAGALRGKAALIGATAIELHDSYSVPRFGVIPGPVIQLLAAETLRSESSPIDRGAALPLLLALGAIALAVRTTGRRPLTIIAAGYAGVLAMPLGLETARFGTVTIVPALITLSVGLAGTLGAAALRSLREARMVDHQTGLPNRRGFDEVMAGATVSAVIALRLDSYRDAAGVLGQDKAAELIGRIVDRLNVARTGPIFRLEESVLAWTVVDWSTDDCVDQIEGIAALLRAPVEIAGRQVELRCHFGIAPTLGTGSDAELANHAILAADEAAEHGQRWSIYTADLDRERDWRLTLAGELDQALAAGDIWVAYQPKLDLRSRRVLAAEALVRWRHPQRGAIPPDAFIPVLEESGRILELTLFVLNRAVADAAAWRASGNPINVAVNVSALLATDEAFLGEVAALLGRQAIPPELLTLEVTESAALADPERAVAALNRLAAMGIKLSIDDYGTGQSTLSYLKRLPAKEIKIDKSFVLNIDNNRSDQVMVSSTIALAHELGYRVVAEGVETPAVLELLASFDCDFGQGWHVGRPVAADEFARQFLTLRAAA